MPLSLQLNIEYRRYGPLIPYEYRRYGPFIPEDRAHSTQLGRRGKSGYLKKTTEREPFGFYNQEGSRKPLLWSLSTQAAAECDCSTGGSDLRGK